MMVMSACSECGDINRHRMDGWLAGMRGPGKTWLEWCVACRAYTNHANKHQ